MNWRAIQAIYLFEMSRTGRTIMQSIVSPVLSTSLYFVVFGAAIGTRINVIEGVPYGAFIVPGLIMLTILTQSTMNASFGIYFPRFTGTIYEILSAPISGIEIAVGYVGAAATKSIILGLIILATSWLFVPISIAHPVWMIAFLLLTAITFSLLGFIIGIWADGFEKLQIVPLLIIQPLTFLGQKLGKSIRSDALKNRGQHHNTDDDWQQSDMVLVDESGDEGRALRGERAPTSPAGRGRDGVSRPGEGSGLFGEGAILSVCHHRACPGDPDR